MQSKAVLTLCGICSITILFMTHCQWSNIHNNQRFILQPPSLTANRTNSSKSSDRNKYTQSGLAVCAQDSRQKHLKAACQNLRLQKEKKTPSHSLLIDEEHKIAYCSIPKSASTTWKRILGSSTSAGQGLGMWTHDAHSYKLAKLRGLKYVDIKYHKNYTSYKKFMVVRHPLDRFLSAYFDKMSERDNKSEFEKHRRNIIRKYGQANHSADYRGAMVTFKNFVNYVLSGGSNKHWDSYAFFCWPCHINYDFILRVETLEHDSLQLLAMLNQTRSFFREITGNVSPESSTTHPTAGFSPHHITHYQQLTPMTRRRLVEKFKFDFQLFGYNTNKFNSFNHWQNVSIIYNSCSIKSAGKSCC